MSHTFSRQKEYFRLVATLFATEGGVYKELPDDIATAYIEVDVVYAIVMVSPSGEFSTLSFAPTPAMDKNGLPGGDVFYSTGVGLDVLMFTEPGDGSTALILEQVMSPYLTEDEESLFATLWENLLSEAQQWYA